MAGELWDIEDLVYEGKKAHSCPFYATMGHAESAELVLAPYCFVLDPLVRRSSPMAKILTGAVVIIDEGHNVLQTAQEALSGELSFNDLVHALEEVEIVSESRWPGSSIMLRDFLQAFTTMMRSQFDDMEATSQSRRPLVPTASALISQLRRCGVTEEERENATKSGWQRLQESFHELSDGLSQTSQHLLSKLFLTIEFLLSDDYKHHDSFNVALSINSPNDLRSSYELARPSRHEIQICCMSPAVAFNSALAQVHSVILASGTLSPLHVFATELDTTFDVRLECSHSVDPNSVFIGAIRESQGVVLKCTAQEMKKDHILDEVGKAVLSTCRQIPHGVLVFFASHSALNFFTKRGHSSGIWAELLTVKQCFIEPSGPSSQQAFETTLHQYRHAVQQSVANPAGKGALFLAVCRGKLSEGLDFKDEMARGVVVVGIPYAPPVGKIKLKKEYNDRHVISRGLSGEAWYEQHAYRAVNQALGRCIRHKNDFGAVVLLDSRFSSDKAGTLLSSWIKDKLRKFESVEQASQAMRAFFASSISPLPSALEVSSDSERFQTAADLSNAIPGQHVEPSASCQPTVPVGRSPSSVFSPAVVHLRAQNDRLHKENVLYKQRNAFLEEQVKKLQAGLHMTNGGLAAPLAASPPPLPTPAAAPAEMKTNVVATTTAESPLAALPPPLPTPPAALGAKSTTRDVTTAAWSHERHSRAIEVCRNIDWQVFDDLDVQTVVAVDMPVQCPLSITTSEGEAALEEEATCRAAAEPFEPELCQDMLKKVPRTRTRRHKPIEEESEVSDPESQPLHVSNRSNHRRAPPIPSVLIESPSLPDRHSRTKEGAHTSNHSTVKRPRPKQQRGQPLRPMQLQLVRDSQQQHTDEDSDTEVILEPKPPKLRKPTRVVPRGKYAYVQQDASSDWKVHELDDMGFVVL